MKDIIELEKIRDLLRADRHKSTIGFTVLRRIDALVKEIRMENKNRGRAMVATRSPKP